MKPTGESKNWPTQIQSINFLQKHQGKSIEKGQSFQYRVLQQLNIHIKKQQQQKQLNLKLLHSLSKKNSK